MIVSSKIQTLKYNITSFMLCLGIMLSSLTIIGAQINAAQAASIPLFGTKEIRSSKLSKFTKWTTALARYEKEKPSELNKCALSASNKCHITKWRIFLNKVKAQPQRKQLDYVNQYLNKWAYLVDPTNYGKKDYWATPTQFMTRNGDCEDYAISKYLSLLHLGFTKEQLRVVVLQDLNLKVPHAILVVYLDGKALVMDNQISKVIEANRIKHYKPIFSIGEKNWWLHRG
jgi:predicted transglutaminase-like cysteine proteinase